MASISFSSFFGIFSFFFHLGLFKLFFTILTVPLWLFYVLFRSAMSLSLGRVTLLSRFSVGPSGVVTQFTCTMCSRSHMCGLCMPPVVAEPCLLLAH